MSKRKLVWANNRDRNRKGELRTVGKLELVQRHVVVQSGVSVAREINVPTKKEKKRRRKKK